MASLVMAAVSRVLALSHVKSGIDIAQIDLKIGFKIGAL
jgi:hypothetical protein